MSVIVNRKVIMSSSLKYACLCADERLFDHCWLAYKQICSQVRIARKSVR